MSQVDHIVTLLNTALFGRTVLAVEKAHEESDLLVIAFDDGSCLYLKYIFLDAGKRPERGDRI